MRVPSLSVGLNLPSGFQYVSPERRTRAAENAARVPAILRACREHAIHEVWFRPEKDLWKGLGGLKALEGFRVIPIVPHVARFVREVSAYGTAGAGVRRFLEAPILSKARLAMVGMVEGARIVRREFPALLRLLLAMELGELREARPDLVYLDALATDLLLAFGRIDLFSDLRAFVGKRFCADLGLHTRNLGLLLSELDRCGSDVQAVLGPAHSDGLGMRPEETSCLAALRTTRREVAVEVLYDLAGMEVPEEVKFWRSLNVARVAVGVVAADDVKHLIDGVRAVEGYARDPRGPAAHGVGTGARGGAERAEPPAGTQLE